MAPTRILLVTFLLTLAANPAYAEEIKAMQEEEMHSDEAEQHGGEEAHHRFAIGVFLGATHVQGEDENTYGFELGYHINENWSTGLVVEQSERDRHSTLILVGLGWHPYRGWRFSAGVGKKDPSGQHENVGRLGLAYEFEFQHGWFIKPHVAVDFIEHEEKEEVVYGAFFGKAF